MGQLTEKQVAVLVVVERVTACVSLVGTLLIVSTFIACKSFRNLSNTLIIYASFGNIMANVASLIGYFGISNGVESPLCQFQAFLVEMFMQADPFWSLAMAINVYLVFIRGHDIASLRRLFWIYTVLCYGLPFIVAIACLLIRDPVSGRIYGDATLWCWVSDKWIHVRIYAFYAPIWSVGFISLLIYIRVGYEIRRKRKQVQAMEDFSFPSNVQGSGPFAGIRMTEVEVTHNRLSSRSDMRLEALRHKGANKHRYSVSIGTYPTPYGALSSVQTGTDHGNQSDGVDMVKWAYMKCAILFAISNVVTWVPASINRIYSIVFPSKVSFALSVSSAALLPLQGFWNSIIYFVVSWVICKDVWASWRASRAAAAAEAQHLPRTKNEPPRSILSRKRPLKSDNCPVSITGARPSKDSDSATVALENVTSSSKFFGYAGS